MFFKLLWLFAVAWIAYRVWIAARNIFRIAMGHEEIDGRPPLGGTHRGAPGFGGFDPFGRGASAGSPGAAAGGTRPNHEAGARQTVTAPPSASRPRTASEPGKDVEDARFEDL